MQRVIDLEGGNYRYYCPGCQRYHTLNTTYQLPNGAVWSFSGDLANPTFAPAVDYRSGIYADARWVDVLGLGSERCHHKVEHGMIKYAPDCSHTLAGKNVLLPAVTE